MRGSINGGGVDFLVDTGATLVALSEPIAQRLALIFAPRVSGEWLSTASGAVPAHWVILERITIGEIELSQVEPVIWKAIPSHALLDMSFLGRLEMRNNDLILELQNKI